MDMGTGRPPMRARAGMRQLPETTEARRALRALLVGPLPATRGRTFRHRLPPTSQMHVGDGREACCCSPRDSPAAPSQYESAAAVRRQLFFCNAPASVYTSANCRQASPPKPGPCCDDRGGLCEAGRRTTRVTLARLGLVTVGSTVIYYHLLGALHGDPCRSSTRKSYQTASRWAP